MLKDNGNFNIVWKVTEEEIANTSDNDKCVALITVNKPINFEKKMTIENITNKLNQEIEKMILNKPDQWIWSHDRWK